MQSIAHRPVRLKIRLKTANTNKKNPVTVAVTGFLLEVTPGFEPGNEGFADLCLTAWPRHRMKLNIRNATAFLILPFWSG